jgi:inner membrane transporter RhtA
MAVISVVLAMLSIQTGAALAKDLFPLVGSVGTTALRLVFAAIILCVVFRPWRDMPRGKGWVPVCLYGAALGGMNILFYMAIERIPLGVAIALEFTGPLAVALWAARSLRDMVWVACAVAGIFLLLPVTEFSAALDPLGVALALGAGVGWALYIVFGQRSGEDAHGGRVVALGMCVAALLYAPIGVWTAGVTLLNGHVLAFGLMIAVLSSALPYSLEMGDVQNKV